MKSHKIASLSLATLLLGIQALWDFTAAECFCMQKFSLQEQTFVHPWKGKRVAFLGDSITDKCRIGTEKCYWEYLAEWLNINPLVYAINGRQWDDIPRQASQLKEEIGNEVDAIIIFIGTNDYNAGIPLGEWWSIETKRVEEAHGEPKQTVERAHRVFNKDNTFKGRINQGLCTLKKLYPDKQIVLLTPIHRAFATFGDNNIQPDENYMNVCGHFIDDYINAIKEAGNLWAMPVIDLNSLSGLYPLEDGQTHYFHNERTDRLHPGKEGHKRIAKTLLYQLVSLPCVFD